MIRYLFTNDLRISTLETSLINAAKLIQTDSVPSASVDKSANNNINTLAFYFNLKKGRRVTDLAIKGNTRQVVLNFIKKFQFPNPRTTESYNNAMADGVCFAPMRSIVKLLYIGFINDGGLGYLTRDEISEFLFYNTDVAKNRAPNYVSVYLQIKEYRKNHILPVGVVPTTQREWNQSDRQLREMCKVLKWAGFVTESEDGKLSLNHSNLAANEKSEIFDIMTYSAFWEPDKQSYEEYMDASEQDEQFINEEEPMEKNATEKRQTGGINKIFYGAPGCGKSHIIKAMLDDAGVVKENKIRTTFHPEYSNSDFIGQILPTVEVTDDGNERVKYVFNPGPFTVALETAYNTTDMVYLVVEEINRGNAAAIFGDMFQLLDRNKDSDSNAFGESEYYVCNPNMQKHLMDNVTVNDVILKLPEGVYIPSNLTILATMNTSDQNVFTLDTAFKRRWSFEQISNDIERDNEHEYKGWYIPGSDVTWEKFLIAINNKILDYKIHNQANEDKRLGKYFVTKDCLTEEVAAISDVQDIAKNFAYKVLEYVWNDVCKIGREEWFNTETYRTLEDLIDAFINPTTGNPLSVFQNISFEN